LRSNHWIHRQHGDVRAEGLLHQAGLQELQAAAGRDHPPAVELAHDTRIVPQRERGRDPRRGERNGPSRAVDVARGRRRARADARRRPGCRPADPPT